MLKLIFSFILVGGFLHADTLAKGNQQIAENFNTVEHLYDLNEGEEWREITDKVLASDDTPELSKDSIRTYHRRIFVFKYPSDGLSIKGFISFTPEPNHHPLLILYRWGNENFALMNPGIPLATWKNYTVVSSTLRGGISEGNDEFGGADIDDMNNLINFLPALSDKLKIELNPNCVFMLGPSRGGMEMFLTLAHFPKLQNHVDKIVALSSILDVHQLIKDRPDDMKLMLEEQYGLPKDLRAEAWIKKRDPIETAPLIKKSLPVLIVQGTDDPRIQISESRHMFHALRAQGVKAEYWEVPGGNHILTNTPNTMNDIMHWLETNAPCMEKGVEKGKQQIEKNKK